MNNSKSFSKIEKKMAIEHGVSDVSCILIKYYKDVEFQK